MMDNLAEKFERIGARLVVTRAARRRQPQPSRTAAKPFDLDVRRDAKGEHFTLRVFDPAQEFRVLQANAAARHLLLYAPGAGPRDAGERFLCGHDERHWFVAAVKDRVSNITAAKRSLLPDALKDAGLTPDDLARRHTAAFKRQGEWFFVPTDKDLSGKPILRGEPLLRGRNGKPHVASELVRFGGQMVVLSGGTEYTPEAFEAACAANPELRQRNARRMVKDAEVYVRGPVRHRDHATLVLDGWHRVYVNGEALSENMSFYD
ncbi:MAG TPA: hypothetical protein VFN38_07575 [Gemmatimonadaceae bacterium]|nr:hypothetical protein [Gemmatimonadaceae bacterium]